MAMYSYDDEIRKLTRKIRESETKSDIAKNKKLLEQLKVSAK